MCLFFFYYWTIFASIPFGESAVIDRLEKAGISLVGDQYKYPIGSYLSIELVQKLIDGDFVNRISGLSNLIAFNDKDLLYEFVIYERDGRVFRIIPFCTVLMEAPVKAVRNNFIAYLEAHQQSILGSFQRAYDLGSCDIDPENDSLNLMREKLVHYSRFKLHEFLADNYDINAWNDAHARLIAIYQTSLTERGVIYLNQESLERQHIIKYIINWFDLVREAESEVEKSEAEGCCGCEYKDGIERNSGQDSKPEYLHEIASEHLREAEPQEPLSDHLNKAKQVIGAELEMDVELDYMPYQSNSELLENSESISEFHSESVAHHSEDGDSTEELVRRFLNSCYENAIADLLLSEDCESSAFTSTDDERESVAVPIPDGLSSFNEVISLSDSDAEEENDDYAENELTRNIN